MEVELLRDLSLVLLVLHHNLALLQVLGLGLGLALVLNPLHLFLLDPGAQVLAAEALRLDEKVPQDQQDEVALHQLKEIHHAQGKSLLFPNLLSFTLISLQGM